MIREVFDLFGFCDDGVISPECIDTPSDIAISRTSDDIPPRVDICDSRIGLSPDIMPAIRHTTIHPGSLEWMESDLAIIGLRSSQIDGMMGTVDIPTP